MDFKNNSDHFDQHFLIDKEVIKKFIEVSNLKKSDIVVEIGPGKGYISKIIAERVKKLYCIELDERLKPFLNVLQKENKNVEVIYSNALITNIPRCTKIITALPYSIIEPFVKKMLSCTFDELIMITGKKYATNVEERKINNLSLLTNCYFDFERIIDIPPKSFDPAPRVMSSIVKLIPIKADQLNDFNLLVFRYMFYFKTKKVRNSLVESLIKSYEHSKTVLTQKMSKNIIEQMSLGTELLEKKFEDCSNKDLELLNQEIKKL